MNRSAFAALAALMVACAADTGKTDSGTTDVSDTTTDTTGGTCPGGFYTGPVVVEMGSATCAADTVTFDVQTAGWTSGGMVYSIQTSAQAWADEHDVESYEFEECGAWDHLGATVPTVLDAADAVRNEGTLFACAIWGDGTMTHAAAVNDFDGNFADCLAWGNDPQGVIDGTRLSIYNYETGPTFDESQCVVGTTTM
jgi:hypothetical protein